MTVPSTHTFLRGGGDPPLGTASVVVIGNFDGVHRGHQAVIADAAARANVEGLLPVVVTFDPHPSAVLGRSPRPRLTTVERRAELLLEAGAARVFVRRFDVTLSNYSPERFVRELLADTLSARAVYVGTNFRFGLGRSGDVSTLAELGSTLGFTAHRHPVVGDEKGAYSSSRIRTALAAGDVAEAALVLGRPHRSTGVVAQGARLGRALGYPTANLSGYEEALPADGIYATWVTGPWEGRMRGATAVGVRPTVGDGLARTVETYLLDLGPGSPEFYGAKLDVDWMARLRSEEKFAGLPALQAQMAIDVARARAALG